MNGEIDQGGPAFPVPGVIMQDLAGNKHPVAGMTLRDYFAGQALAGLCSLENNGTVAEVRARHAYTYADAMLVERRKRPTPARQ